MEELVEAWKTWLLNAARFRRIDRGDTEESIEEETAWSRGPERWRGWFRGRVFARQEENAATVPVGGTVSGLNRPVKP